MVQYPATQQESDSAWGMLEGRSIPTWKFSVEAPPGSGNYMPREIGFGYTGRVAEEPQQRQAIDFTTKQPKFYTDGNPIMEIILTLDTDERVDEDDDGKRRWYLNGQARRALQDEMKRLGIKRFGIGSVITATVGGFKPNPKGRATMLFNVQLQPTQYVPPVFQEQPQVPGAQQQWASPAQPQFPGQVVPAAQPQYQAPAQQYQQAPQYQAPQPPAQPQYQAPQLPAQPQYQAPQPPAQPQYQPNQGVDYAALGAQARQQVAQPVAPAPAAPQAPTVGAPQVGAEHVEQVQLLQTTGNIDRGTAIQAVADMAAPGDAGFLAALDAAVTA